MIEHQHLTGVEPYREGGNSHLSIGNTMAYSDSTPRCAQARSNVDDFYLGTADKAKSEKFNTKDCSERSSFSSQEFYPEESSNQQFSLGEDSANSRTNVLDQCRERNLNSGSDLFEKKSVCPFTCSPVLATPTANLEKGILERQLGSNDPAATLCSERINKESLDATCQGVTVNQQQSNRSSILYDSTIQSAQAHSNGCNGCFEPSLAAANPFVSPKQERVFDLKRIDYLKTIASKQKILMAKPLTALSRKASNCDDNASNGESQKSLEDSVISSPHSERKTDASDDHKHTSPCRDILSKLNLRSSKFVLN